MKTNQRHNLTQQLTHTLGNAIAKGDYAVGDSLPSEADLCIEHEVSRSATREAVKMLSAKGLIASRPKKGIKVLTKDHWNMFDPDVLGWILSGTPTLRMLKEFLQLRMAIEPSACALAAVHQDNDKILLIHNALERMKAADKGLDDSLDADIAFHLAILAASGNPFYIQLQSFVETALRVSIRYTNKIKGVSASFDAHKKIYDAIANGNASKAKEASEAIQAEALNLICSKLDLQ